jgi:hypothetical protein
MILIFLCLNFSESSSQVYINSELWLLNLESRYQTNWNTSDYNLDLKFGVSYDIFGGGFLFLTKKLDFLQIGYNHNGVDDFLSFNLLKYEKIDSWKECKENKEVELFYYSHSIDLILINRDCIHQKEANWFKLGVGIGYDFLKNQKDFLLAEGLMKLGYTTLELNNNVGKLLNSNTALGFDGFDIELGARVQYINRGFKLIVGSNFKKMFDKMDLNILENGIEIVLSGTIIEYYSLGYVDPYEDWKNDDVRPINVGGSPIVDYEVLNLTLFGNYNLYSTNNTTTAIPIVGLKLKIYAGLFADRWKF